MKINEKDYMVADFSLIRILCKYYRHQEYFECLANPENPKNKCCPENCFANADENA